MIQPIQIVQNNYGYNIPFTLEDGDGNALSLSGATVTLKVQDSQNATGTLVALGGNPMIIDVAADGTCHYVVANGDFPNPGVFLAEVLVTFPSGPVSYPGIQIIVQPTLPKAMN